MSHPVHDVIAFEVLADYRLRVSFDGGKVQEVDLEPVLNSEMYGPLHEWPRVGQAIALRLQVAV